MIRGWPAWHRPSQGDREEALKVNPKQKVALTELSGMPVHGPDGEQLGKIEDISIDVREGAIDGARLRLAESHSGSGRPLTIDLPWSLLSLDADGRALELDIGLPTLVTVATRRMN
jgi:sporulation protein YlmC with PRC-barrel domain